MTWEDPFVCLATQLLIEVWQFGISFSRVLMNLCHFLHENPFFFKSKPYFSFWKFCNLLPKRKFTIASFNLGISAANACLAPGLHVPRTFPQPPSSSRHSSTFMCFVSAVTNWEMIISNDKTLNHLGSL
jgi:hypothetical protein